MTLSLASLIALGYFYPPPSASHFANLLFYLPFIITMLPPLITAAAFEKIDNVNLRLNESEKTFRGLYSKTPVMMHSLDTDGRLVSVSDTWLAKLGYRREEVLGRKSIEFLTPASQKHALEVVLPQFNRDGYVENAEYQMLCRNGSVIDVRLSGIWELDSNDQRIRTLAVVIDVTEEKKLAALIDSEKSRLASIIDGTGVGTWELNVATSQIRLNDRWFEVLGHSRSEYSRADWEALIHPDDIAAYQDLLERHIKGINATYSQELRMRHNDGQWIWMLAKGRISTYADNGSPEWIYGTHLDISDIKASEQAAEEGKDFLERTGQIAGIGAWAVDLKHNQVMWSDQTCRIHDLPPGHVPTMEEALSYYEPSARSRIQEAISTAIETHQPWDLELPMVSAFGRFIWARVVGEVELDRNGQPARLVGAFQDITERKTAEAELERLNSLIRNILQAASEVAIIATDVDGVIQVFNSGAERLLGYRAYELCDKQTPAIFHDQEEVEERGRQLSAALGSQIVGFKVLVAIPEIEGAEIREWTYVRKDGGRVPVSLTVTPMKDGGGKVTGYLGIATDITRVKADQRAISAARDQLELAIEVAEMGIWTWDIASNTLIWNDRMYQFYDQPMELKAGGLSYENWRERVHPDDVDAAAARLMAALEGKATFDPTFRVVRRDGSVRYIQAGAQVERDQARNPIRVTGINRDITDQLQLESSLRRAKEQADFASTAKSSFLANMSHEIRTPMNAVLGMLQLVQRTALDARQQDYVAKADTAAKSLLGILNDILDFSKVEAGKLELDPHPFDVEQLLRDLAVVLSGNLGGKDVELLFEVDPALPRTLVADRLRLQQILINLSGNAIKFTQQGEVVISFMQQSRADHHVNLRIAVRDTGIGIAAEQLEKIFDGFSQAEASTTRRFGGTGLGLAISRRLVQIMGSDIAVSSEPGRGSEFSFELCLPVSDTPPLVTLVPDLPRSLRLLVVDDNPTAREVVSGFCEHLGWHADQAASGTEALEMANQARLAGKKYDVVLMDWHMPGMDGLTTASVMRDLPNADKPPVIVMVTAYGREALLESQATMNAPFADFLTKPLTPNQLTDVLARILSGNAPARPQSPVPEHPRRLERIRILVVEDNALNRQVALELLSAEGARVTMAEAGLPGVQLASESAQQFDVVLMDIQMPDIDGLEATRRIRQKISNTELPILAMTANASGDDREACLAAGMDGHIGKPFDIDELVSNIVRLVGQESPPPGSPSSPEGDGYHQAITSALRRFGGNKLLLNATLASFKSEANQQLAQCERAISAKSLIVPLHTLKGLAMTVGANELGEYAAQLERGVKQRGDSNFEHLTTDQVSKLRQLLEQNHSALTAKFAEVVGIEPQETIPLHEALTISATVNRLTEIVPLLEGGNMKAIEMMDNLTREVSPTVLERLQPISAHIQSLAFLDAIGQINALVSDLTA
ncbi:hypothetical protein GCM10007907_24510 [Chitinimonas prasina]|uniref:histidine kinase n=2 Tax=Chitinimonas prasina TaxID=1434937 RepID=A0ABQ5YGE5_9NEIS|nr:hypothetical protein GCM10007907_24510 [Chitinimonas prasina]